jgi:prepilin-type N-terminal cleavage/methylation domain-containing protein
MTGRRGFSLAELIVALVIAGIIGVALTRLVVNQARFVGSQDGMMRARASARAALNLLTYELRETTNGGVLAATNDSIDVRIPYAFGLVCGYAAGRSVLSVIPPDSAAWASAAATTSGYAWLNSSNAWVFVEPATRTSGSTAACTTATPAVVLLNSPGGLNWGTHVSGTAASVGTLVYLYQNVRYAFAPSVQLPGRIALWRTTLANNVREELVAPFDTSAEFDFLVGPMLSVRTTVPTVLDSISGLRLMLNAQSENPPQGRTAPLLFRVTSDLVFRNHES